MGFIKPMLCNQESGAAILEFLAIVPIILLFAAGVLDTSLYISTSMALDSAATAALRYCMDYPNKDEEVLTGEVSSYIETIAPNLEGAEVRIAIGSALQEPYTHILYPDDSENYVERKNSLCLYRPVSVCIAYKSNYYTLIGRSISLASGGDGSLSAEARKNGNLDMTGIEAW